MTNDNQFTNPYLSPTDVTSLTPEKQKSVGMRLLIGFCVGASIPASLGGYGLYQFHAYVASLPPEVIICGNGAFGPMMLIVIGAPLFGVISALVAAVLP